MAQDRPAFAFRHSNGLGVLKVNEKPVPAALKAFFESVKNPEDETRIRSYFSRLGETLTGRVDEATTRKQFIGLTQNYAGALRVVNHLDGRVSELERHTAQMGQLLKQGQAQHGDAERWRILASRVGAMTGADLGTVSAAIRRLYNSDHEGALEDRGQLSWTLDQLSQGRSLIPEPVVVESQEQLTFDRRAKRLYKAHPAICIIQTRPY